MWSARYTFVPGVLELSDRGSATEDCPGQRRPVLRWSRSVSLRRMTAMLPCSIESCTSTTFVAVKPKRSTIWIRLQSSKKKLKEPKNPKLSSSINHDSGIEVVSSTLRTPLRNRVELPKDCDFGPSFSYDHHYFITLCTESAFIVEVRIQKWCTK